MLVVLAAFALCACASEGKLPFRDDTLLKGSSEEEQGSGGSAGSGGAGGFGSYGGFGGASGRASDWLDESCWSQPTSCDPRDNAGCSSGASCDTASNSDGSVVIRCFDPPNTQSLGDYCDNDGGPYCAGGMHCFSNVCYRFCCDFYECNGGECVPLHSDYGNLGVCASLM
jgi:hypothetical protein